MIIPIRTTPNAFAGAAPRPVTRNAAHDPTAMAGRVAGRFHSRKRQSVEFIMSLRMSRFVSRGFVRPALTRADDPQWWDDHHAAMAEREAETEARKPENWLQSKQIALLLIERSAAATDCIAHMPQSADTTDRQRDFAWLRTEGYAVRPLGERYHRLTPFGIRAARELIATVAKRLSLHHVSYSPDSFNENRARCTCGFSASASRHGNANPRATLNTAITRHLADPQEWIRARERGQKIIDGFGGDDA